MYGFTKFVFNLGLGVLKTLFLAQILIYTWMWFIVPEFALRPLTMRGAVGITIVSGLLQSSSMISAGFREAKEDMRAKGEFKWTDTGWAIVGSFIVLMIVYPLMLLFTYLWHRGLG